MSWSAVLQRIREVTNIQLFQISNTTVSVGSVLAVLVIVAGSFWISRIVQRLVATAFKRGGVQEEGTLSTVRRLTHYLVLLTGLAVALQVVGVSLGSLLAAGAFVAVGIGFALQNILQNFVSGVILLAEQSITERDVLEVAGEMVLVEKIGARATVARTREDEQLIIPNSTLVQSTVTNYTLSDTAFRIRARVGVAYGSDMDDVAAALNRAGESVEGRLTTKPPAVLLLEFGDSSVVWEVSIWGDDPWQARFTRSHLNRAIWSTFKAEGITIAFPQVDVHFDPEPPRLSLSGQERSKA